MVMTLMIMKGAKDMRPPFMRRNRKVIFNSPISPNLGMPYRIETMVHELIEPEDTIA